MSYTPPLFTDAGGSLASGYVAPTFSAAGGDVDPLPPEPPGPAQLPTTSIALPVIVVQLTIGATTYYFSDIEYGDNNTNWHDTRVTGDIAFSRDVSCVLWGQQRGASGMGNIELINNDGELDALLIESQAASTVAVYVVDQDQPMSAATAIAAAVVTRIEAQGEQTVRIVTGDVLALLDVPLQTSLYASGDGADTLIGRPRPTAIGNPLSCPVVLVNEVDYEYDCHDSDTFDVVQVRDMGYPLVESVLPDPGWSVSVSPGINGIELHQVPVGRVVADISATTFAAETIISNTGNFETDLTDWTDETSVFGAGFASATWDAAEFAVLYAGSYALGDAGIARLTFPATLVGGQRYTWAVFRDVTASGLTLFSVSFRPDNLDPASYVNLLLEYGASTGTVSGTFTAPADGKFSIAASAQNVGGEITANIDNVSLARVSSGGGVTDVIELLLARAGIGVDQFDATALTALAADRPWACSYWADGAERIGDVLQQVLDSVYGWMFTNAAGQITVGYLIPPEFGATEIEITATELAGEIEVEPDLAPGLSTTVAGSRNWYTYGDGELADALSDADRALLTADYRVRRTSVAPVGVELRNRAGAAVSDDSASGIATLLDDDVDIQAAADYLALLYPAGQPRRFYKIPVFLSRVNVATLAPGDKITLTYDRFGCDTGRPLRIVGISGRAGDDLVILRCWGSAVDPIDPGLLLTTDSGDRLLLAADTYLRVA